METPKTHPAPPHLILPKGYKPLLDPLQTARSLQKLKQFFEQQLEQSLNVDRVSAPLFVRQHTGINDDLNGIERAVSFPMKGLREDRAEVVQSLAKWKRMALAEYNIRSEE